MTKKSIVKAKIEARIGKRRGKTSPPKMDRYAYEKAEAILDSYVQKKGVKMFQRAYQHLKWLVLGLAHIDFSFGGHSKEKCMSFAWEDAHIGFTGYGSEIITGAVMALWTNLDESEWDELHAVITEAFNAAEDATAKDVTRRYLPKYRNKPIRRLDEGFDLPCVVPMFGPVLHDWAADTGDDPVEVAQRMVWVEEAMEEITTDHQDEKPAEKKRPSLTLVSDNDTIN